MGIDELLITLDRVSDLVEKDYFDKTIDQYVAKNSPPIQYARELCGHCIVYPDNTYNWSNIRTLRKNRYVVGLLPDNIHGICGYILIRDIALQFGKNN